MEVGQLRSPGNSGAAMLWSNPSDGGGVLRCWASQIKARGRRVGGAWLLWAVDSAEEKRRGGWGDARRWPNRRKIGEIGGGGVWCGIDDRKGGGSGLTWKREGSQVWGRPAGHGADESGRRRCRCEEGMGPIQGKGMWAMGMAAGGPSWASFLGAAQKHSTDFYLFKYLKMPWIEMVQRKLSRAQKFSNKIWIYRELNKEQLNLLEPFKISNRIWIKNQWSSRVWNSIDFDGIWLEFSRIGEFWTRSSWLHLDDTSTHEKEFQDSNLRVSRVTSTIRFEFIWILTLFT
jgi:hypothetical protein